MTTRHLILLALVLAFPTSAQTVRYVTDSLKLEARTGPTTSNRIVRMIASGTPVTVLENKDGYSRIQLAGGTEAWILTRYLMDEPSARNALAAARSSLETITKENEQLKSQLAEALSVGQSSQQARDQLEERSTNLAEELKNIRRTAAATLSINRQNQELQERVVNLERDLQLAQQENQAMSDGEERDWFVAGAGVLFGGMILGLIIPRLRWKKRRGWGEL